MHPIRTVAPDFIDRLLTANADFRELMEAHHKEADGGKVSSLETVGKVLQGD
jgi:hypothetical protein